MRIVFDWALDGPSWPGPVGGLAAVDGECWVGPLGLLGVLETRLGLGGQFDGVLQRACRLAGQLESLDGYWRASFEVDRLATARRLLRERDELWLWGWAGQPVSARLAQLHEATRECSAGVPDRVAALVGALKLRRPRVESVVSHTPLKWLPPLWGQLFEALRAQGVAVQEQELTPSAASGAVGEAGEGRLCLLRRHGPVDLADEVAASLAAHDRLEGVLLIGADGVLDHALSRHGLPTSGAFVGATGSSELLPLAIKAAFRPVEMADLHALLAADPGPVPKALAVKLIRALQSIPGRESPEWLEALREETGDPESKERARQLLTPVVSRSAAISVTALRERLSLLSDWARARAAFIPSLLELAARIRTLHEAIELTGATELSLSKLLQLCDALGPSQWQWRPAEAGLSHVRSAGAVLGPARAVVWWNFSREAAPRPEQFPISRAEREGLSALGLRPPDASLATAITARAWRRPLMLATDVLVLACPLQDAAGEPNAPHPLWDEISAGLPRPEQAHRLERSELILPSKARRVAVPSRALVSSSPAVTARAPLRLREVESPSSVETLLGCSLLWALKYAGKVGRGLADGPPALGPLLYGSLSHRLFEQVVERPFASADEAADLAASVFDSQCDRLCEDLALPHQQAARATVRRAVVESARELARLALKHRATGSRAESGHSVDVDGQRIEGWVDLSWATPPVVLDLKWGKSTNLEKLGSGTAIQLAAYAAMRRAAGEPAESAYFTLQTQELLGEPGGLLAPDASAHAPGPLSDTWAATVAGLRRRREELAAGTLQAPGATGEDVKAALSGGTLTVSPPCKYCELDGLCGRTGAQ